MRVEVDLRGQQRTDRIELHGFGIGAARRDLAIELAQRGTDVVKAFGKVVLRQDIHLFMRPPRADQGEVEPDRKCLVDLRREPQYRQAQGAGGGEPRPASAQLVALSPLRADPVHGPELQAQAEQKACVEAQVVRPFGGRRRKKKAGQSGTEQQGPPGAAVGGEPSRPQQILPYSGAKHEQVETQLHEVQQRHQALPQNSGARGVLPGRGKKAGDLAAGKGTAAPSQAQQSIGRAGTAAQLGEVPVRQQKSDGTRAGQGAQGSPLTSP